MDNQEKNAILKIHLTQEGDKVTVDLVGYTKELTLLLAVACKASPQLKEIMQLSLLVGALTDNEMASNSESPDTE